MTDVTNEQRAAWARLSNSPDAAGATGSLEDDVALIVPLLPDSLTNPQPALPTEPGHYLDAHNDVVELFEGEWYFNGARRSLDEVSSYAPLARLVPERPEPSWGEIQQAWDVSRDTDESIPREFDGRMLAANAYFAGYKAGAKR